ncbi:MAG: tetratricopeptide repeat protein [Desulfonatronovibrio sp.]
MDINNAVLINIDAHDDLRWISPEKLEDLQKIFERRGWQALQEADSPGDKGLYHIGSFIYAAYHLGIVSEIYWIIPFTHFQSPDAVTELNNFLDDYGFQEQDIKNFAMNEGCFKGLHYGIPLTICDIHNLPHIPDTAVLSIDADFLPSFADWNNLDILSSLSVLFKALAEKEYAVQDAVVSTSVDGGYLNITRRWAAVQCLDFLAGPENMHSAYPEAWLVRNLADIYYQNGLTEALLELTNRYRTRRDSDSSLTIYRSFALLASGDEQEAFASASSLARTDKRYAYVLADLGQCLLDKGDLDKAIKYFETAYHIHPEMNYRQKNLADGLLMADRLDQALRYYEQFQQTNGSFPTQFVMGYIWLRLGEEYKAEKCFEAGLSGLQSEKYATVENQIDILAVREAASFFSAKNLVEKAKLIVSHPGLKHLFNNQE